MFEKLKMKFRRRIQPTKQLTELAEASRQSDLAAARPDELAPRDANLIFAFCRDLLLMEIALRAYPAFSLEEFRRGDQEGFWQLCEMGVRVEKLTRPIAAEVLLAWVRDYGNALCDAAKNWQGNFDFKEED